MLRKWIDGVGQSILATIFIALVLGVFVTWLVKIRSAWGTPLLLGLAAATMAALFAVLAKAGMRLPPKRLIPNSQNIEECIRTWLNNFNYGIKNTPDGNAHFCLLVTADSDTKMVIGRLKAEKDSEYVYIKAIIGPTGEELGNLNRLTEQEKAKLFVSIKLELSRRRIGYRGLIFPPNDFFIFKRVPISSSLTEHEFLSSVDEIEAAVNAVFNLGAMNFVESSLYVPPAQIESEAAGPLQKLKVP